MQTKDRPPFAALFQICITSVLPRGAIYDRKAKTNSVDFLGTYKGLKERFSNGRRHSAATVNHPNMKQPLVFSKRDF